MSDLDQDELLATRKLNGLDDNLYIDGRDINVGSIEQNIKILYKLVTTKFNNDYSIDNVDKEAIENLLLDYTRQKQINEEHQKINGELREKVKELEKESKENKKKYLALLLGQFPDTTEIYKKYKKELDKLLEETNG